MLKELTSGEIEDLLASEVLARIGCHADGVTYVVPITYAYDKGSLIGHSAVGMKIEMMRKNPSVCVEVDQMKNMASWRSVIAWGTYRELEGEDAARAMRILMNRLVPLITSSTSRPMHEFGPSHGADTAGRSGVIFRIDLDKKTGRYERR